jgi:NADH-quinone oxidoreductase subunit M
MILIWLIAVPMISGLLSWLLDAKWSIPCRCAALFGSLINLILAILIWIGHAGQFTPGAEGAWLESIHLDWIPRAGISFSLALDGISLLMIMLTALLGTLSVIISWTEIKERVGFFHFNLMWILAGITGVFLAMDLFLFYFFWEVMLVPMYFLIAIWGHERRQYASIKFFLFTQLSGLFMLAAILGLAFIHKSMTGVMSFDYFDLIGLPIDISVARWLMFGFLIAFAVKLPAVPFHTWLADAHTEAPTAGSVILAGLLLKTGAYGMIRFVLPLFPEAAAEIAYPAMLIGVIGIIYGAKLALGQTDMKRLVAYTSVSHLGFVLLGIFSFNTIALQGSIIEMLCHGFSTGGLFILVGLIQEHIHTRDMNRMGGFWSITPRLGGVAMVLALASLGLPGLGNFVGEILILIGAFKVSAVLAVLATVGLVLATVYSLWIIQQTFHGDLTEKWRMPDLRWRHGIVFAAVIFLLLWIGLYPNPVLNTSRPYIRNISETVTATAPPESPLRLEKISYERRNESFSPVATEDP